MISKEYFIFKKDNVYYRKCTSCEITKEYNEYPFDTDRKRFLKNGLRTIKTVCRDCYFLQHPKTERLKNTETNLLLLEQGKRKCSGCSTIKEFKYFWRNNTSTGYTSKCIECDKKRKKNSTKLSYIKEAAKRYNISVEEYNKIIADNPNCMICKEGLQTPNIDHCHTTGKVRGVLCKKCNSGLGFFKDNQNILNEAILYLNKHK